MRCDSIHRIIENDLPDDIGITAREYTYAGFEYETGMAVSMVSRDLAVKCYEKAARMGNSDAMVSLAKLYLKEDDPDEYYRWLLEAALHDENREAMFRLGELYFEGTYVSQDYEKALKYFKAAGEAGDERVNYYFGYYADNGILQNIDENRAIEYYIIGAKKFDRRCLERLSALNASIPREESKDECI